MRLLHTADWHLGKTLKGQNLLDDQEYIIEEIFKIIYDEDIEAVMICGDVYDRGVPPVEAVDLLNRTLTRLAEKKIPTLIISGNHDSQTRLNFGNRIFERQKFFFAAKITDEPRNFVLEDKFGEVYFSPIPFFEPAELQNKFLYTSIERMSYNDANSYYLDLLRHRIPRGKRRVVMAHVFLTGGEESESERKIVGTLANVDAKIFETYNYVALGHLHRPQKFYSGSPLKYSFDEAGQKKSVTIVDLDGEGQVQTKRVELTPRRDVRIVNGTIDELRGYLRTEDYIVARLNQYEIGAREKLERNFPNLLGVEFVSRQNLSDDTQKKFTAGTEPLDYFAEFFKAQTGEDLNADYRAAMGDFLSKISKEE